MGIIFALIVIICSLTGGYYSGLQSKLNFEKQLLKELSSKETAPSRSLAFAISVVSDEHQHALGIPQRGPLAVEKALDNMEKQGKDGDLWRSLGDDPLGIRMRRVFQADSHSQDMPGAGLYTRQFLDELRVDLQTGQASLSAALDRVPTTGFPLERSALLLMMSDLGGNTEEVKQQAMNELTRNVVNARPDPSLATTESELNEALSTNTDMMLPISAHLAFLKSSTDPAEALSGTVNGIVSQPDSGVRIALIQQFLEKFSDSPSAPGGPSMEDKLRAALAVHDIQLRTAGTEGTESQ